MQQSHQDVFSSIVIKTLPFLIFSGVTMRSDTCHKLFKDSDNGEEFFIAKTTKVDNLWTCQFIDLDSNRAFAVSFKPDSLESETKAKDLAALATVAFSADTNQEHRFSISAVDEQLIWKRKTKSIKVKLFSFPLQVVNSIQLHKEIFELSQKRLREEEEAKQFFKNNYAKSTEDRKGLLLRVNQMTSDKKTMEEEMYKHFLPILNAKKDKIRELEKALDDQQQNKEPISHKISSSEDDDDGNDGEKSMDTSQNFLNLSEPLL